MAEASDMMFKDSPEMRTFLSGPNCGHFYWGLTREQTDGCILPSVRVRSTLLPQTKP